MKKMKVKKTDIIRYFKKHCMKCSGVCCKKAEFTVFTWELEKLPKSIYPLKFRKQQRRNGKPKNKKIERINMNKSCPYLKENEGCIIKERDRPLDCISYPIYPIIKYGRKEDDKEIIGMMIHKSCPLCREISKDKKLIKILYDFWKLELAGVSKKDLRDWFGHKENYWLDKNIIKIKL